MTTEELNALIAQAEGGDVAAMNQLGQIYGGNEFKDFEKAFYWHKKAAELGNVNSMSNLGGWCYLQGNGTEKNIPLADEWLKKSVENGWVWTWAFNELANIFANDAQYKDLSKAFYWYSKSAEAGDALGMSNLGGWCYLWGNGTEKNLKLAVDWLEKAAEKDNMWSVCKLACDIYSQDNEFKDIDKALVCFEKIVVQYFAVAQPDYDRALKCVEKLAEEGNPKAICLMPKMILNPFGGEKWKWIEKAAEVGDAQCQYKVAEKMLSNNEDEAAYKWFAQSAKGGNADAAARLNELGAEYQFGNNGRTINLPLAYKFYEASADCGNSDGMTNAAYCLSNGIGVEKDFKKCFELYSKAAELGNQFGYSNLGWCHMYGNGTEKNIPEAIKWLAKAADEFGNVWSMNRLTDIYGTFDGFINYEQAAKWFLELIKKDCDPNSGVYEKTGYNKDLYEEVKNAILNSSSENDILSSLSGSTSGGSLLGGSISVVSSNAKSYISQAEELLIKKNNAEKEKLIASIEKDYSSYIATPNRKITGTFVIPDGVKHIGDYAFYECNGLESIVIPESVITIGKQAFEGCKNLRSIVIPDSVTSIGEDAFEYCDGLTSVTLGKNIKDIGSNAFYYCKNLSSLHIPEGLKCIDGFGSCYALNSVDLPDSITCINDYAFYNCIGLTSIIIPNNVTTIGHCAFAHCEQLTSITIPDSVTSIDMECFLGCSKLTGIRLGKGIISIGKDAFTKCPIRNIIIPKGTRQRYENMEGLAWLEDRIVEEE